MPDLVGKPEDRFSHVMAHMVKYEQYTHRFQATQIEHDELNMTRCVGR